MSLYGRGPITAEEHEKIKQIFRNTGALRYSQEQFVKYCIKARRAISGMTKKSANRELLTTLIAFLTDRNI